MKFGLRIPNTGPLASVDNMLVTARRAEEWGYHSLWLSDHVVIPLEIRSRYPFNVSGKFPSPPNTPVFDPLPVMGYVAAVTSRVNIGTNVLILPYRNPVVTAKQIASVDVLSGGRVVLGVGVGWMEEEFEVLHAEPFAQRGPVSDEYIRLYRELWTADEPRFHGRYYQVEGIKFLPKPVRPGGIPIFIGGMTAAAMRRVARLGDGWHAWAMTPDEAARQIERLRGIVRQERRDPARIGVMMTNAVRIQRPGAPKIELTEHDGAAPIVGAAEQVCEALRAYEQAGVDELALLFRGGSYSAILELMEEFMVEVGRKLK